MKFTYTVKCETCSHTLKGRTQAEDVQAYGVEGDIWL